MAGGRPEGAKLLTFNCYKDERELIERAAKISGMNKTSLIRNATLERSRQIIADHEAREAGLKKAANG